MKRFIALFLITISVFLFVGCKSDAPEQTPGDSDAPALIPGFYYAVGEYEQFLTPYLCLETDKNQFSFGAGSVVSYAEHGTYKIEDGVIIAASQSTVFEYEIKFEIKDEKTLVLIYKGDDFPFDIPVGTQFVYSESLK